ncbi:hypothetical protein DENSPDRAFT_472012 [Dentipellis sp. KUC8613]|nr:hypothetical protein DENSPDRAFT_472012 [Dentipellis sp. KUC8613]
MFPLFQRLAATSASRAVFGASRRQYSSNAQFSRARPFLWGSLFAVPAFLALQTHIHLDAPVTIEEEVFVDKATDISFPTTLRIPSKTPLPTYTLLGAGVRTVSFLGIKVYSVGFYADLSNPSLKISKSASPDEKIEHIVRNTSCVLRIIPTRATSFTHLRDAFIRSLQGRHKLARERGTLTPEEQMAVQSPISRLKTIFPNSPLAKHSPVDLLLTAPDTKQPRSLIVRDLGVVQDDWVGRELMLAYFEGNGNSPALKKAVVEKLEDFGV